MNAELSPQLIERPTEFRDHLPNPELCSRCLGIFLSGEYDCEDSQKDGRVLFHNSKDESVLYRDKTSRPFSSDRPVQDALIDLEAELSPQTCPICAIIDLDARDEWRRLCKITYILVMSEGAERYCEIRLYLPGGNKRLLRRLKILSANGIDSQRGWAANLPVSTISDESIELLRKELVICLEKHHECRKPPGTPPTRLLRMERLREDIEYIYLEDCDMNTSYTHATLSHCWGDVQPIRLTKETERALRAGVRSQELPKTFKDAVSLCLRLEFQYVWIDSLCIFQDNLQDWAIEAGAMRSVYKNALLNLAASGATNSSIGLSFERNPLAFRPFLLPASFAAWLCPPDWPARIIPDSPLNKRAWVLQERLLSTRIIHFTTSGVCWECMRCTATEVYPTGFPKMHSLPSLEMASQTLKKALTNSLEVHKKINYREYYHLWASLLYTYTRCDMTNSMDKLVAMQGIAQMMKGTIGVELVCGMWKNILILDLLWRTCGAYRKEDPPCLLQWRAPTWSWANSDFHLEKNSYCTRHLECSALEELAEIKSLALHVLPSGQVSDAALTLRGRPLRASISTEDCGSAEATLTCRDETTTKIGFFDWDRRRSYPSTEELTLVALARCCCTRMSWTSKNHIVFTTMAALMLRRHATNPPTYSRVGVLYLEHEDGKRGCDFFDRHQSTELEDLELV